ncbi:MAG: alcohol dehydrogenase catalytic domain-containing protein [Nitrososphaerota archaeon]|nr:alcohol dehydrogenase catalytic domain-containing protein [Nitrososphaerota archaeon]
MKALVLEGINQIHITDIKTPDCDNTETLLKVIYCSICRTDAKMWFQGQRDLVLPRILGHEICGYDLNSNEKFIVWPANTCNECYYCKNGAENLCSNIQIIGFHVDGGFAPYIKVPKTSLIKVPQNVPPEIACMTELLSSAVNAIEQVDLQKNQNVLIFGGGPAGLMLGLACKYFGAEPVVVENISEKLKQITPFCKKTNITISAIPAVGTFDVAINATPDPNTLREGISKLNPGGKYCLFSGFTKNTNFPTDLLNELHYRQLTLVGAYGSTKRQMETALKILENNTQAIRMLIHKIIPLESVPLVLPEILLGRTLKYVVDLQKYG